MVNRSRTTKQGPVYVNNYRLPSVTTILGATKNQQFLKDWKAKVGEQEAERIKNLSSRRGHPCTNSLSIIFSALATMILQNSDRRRKPWPKKLLMWVLHLLKKYYGSEVTLHYPGLYAGSTDLVCVHNGMETIVDFKQSNRPKQKEWVEDYYLQIAAYAMAHDYVYGSQIRTRCNNDVYTRSILSRI